MHPIQAHLQTLVELDRIGCRKISTGAPDSEEITVYWLKKLWYQSSMRHIFYTSYDSDQYLYLAALQDLPQILLPLHQRYTIPLPGVPYTLAKLAICYCILHFGH